MKIISRITTKKIKAFISTLALVVTFFVLIAFSFYFFNFKQGDLSEVPLVNDIIDFITRLSQFFDEISKKIDFVNIFRKK